MQCTRHAVHMQCTCSAHAVHMRDVGWAFRWNVQPGAGTGGRAGLHAQQDDALDDALVRDALTVAEVERYLLRVWVRVRVRVGPLGLGSGLELGPLGLGRLTLSPTLHAEVERHQGTNPKPYPKPNPKPNPTGIERHQGTRPLAPRPQLAEAAVGEALRPAVEPHAQAIVAEEAPVASDGSTHRGGEVLRKVVEKRERVQVACQERAH
eukprot:scaffold38934_cov55-Phaeocystis_antarctica.AAC.3